MGGLEKHSREIGELRAAATLVGIRL